MIPIPPGRGVDRVLGRRGAPHHDAHVEPRADAERGADRPHRRLRRPRRELGPRAAPHGPRHQRREALRRQRGHPRRSQVQRLRLRFEAARVEDGGFSQGIPDLCTSEILIQNIKNLLLLPYDASWPGQATES